MTTDSSLRSYRIIATQTASPGHLILQLFDGSIRFLERALAGFQKADPLEFNLTINNNVIRAQQIIKHLNDSLDMNKGGELSATLRRLYNYLQRRLTQSNLRKSADGIEESLQHLTELRDAWRDMLNRNSQVHTAPELFAPVLT
jgi:flagellar secretion chaperone FliS